MSRLRFPMLTGGILTLAAILACTRQAAAQGFRDDGRPSPLDEARADRQFALNTAQINREAKDFEHALAELKKAVQLSRQIFGNKGAEVAADLALLGDCALEAGKYAESRAAFAEATEIGISRHGQNSWQAAYYRELSKDCDLVERLSPDDLQNLREAWHQLHRLQRAVTAIFDFQDAPDNPELSPRLPATGVFAKQFGPQHRRVMLAHVNNARAFSLNGDMAGALRQAYAAWDAAQLLHQHDADAVAAMQALADRLVDAADMARAETIYQECIRRQTAAGRAKTEDFAATLNNLALVYESLGDITKAQPLYEQAYQVYLELPRIGYEWKSLVNGRSLAMSETMARLGGTANLGSRVRSEFKVSLEPTGIGDERRLLLNLASAAIVAGNLSDARRYLDLEAQQKAEEAESLQGFGGSAMALPLLEAESLAIRSIFNQISGYLPQAEERAVAALALNRRYLPPNHPKLRVSLNNLAVLKIARGDRAAAVGLARECLKVMFANARLCAATQSIRQQMALTESSSRFLGTYLTLAADSASGISADEAYQQVLQWKGAATLQALQERPQAGEASDRRAARESLHRARRRLAAAYLREPRYFAPGSEDPEREETEKLIAEVDRLESQMHGGASGKAPHGPQAALANLRGILQNGSALIDVVEYQRYAVVDQRTRRHGRMPWLCAFVVPQAGPVRLIDLGSSEAIGAEVEAWRKGFGASAGAKSPGAELRRLVWEKLEPQIGEVKRVIVSPAGPLALFPWAALPGKAAGSFLLEERLISYASAPAVLPHLVTKPARDTIQGAASLLAIGDVDFGCDPGAPKDVSQSRAAPRTRGGSVDLSSLAELPGSCLETLSLARLYRSQFPQGSATVLRRQNATEQSLRESIAGSGFVHLATHGFFGSATAGSGVAAGFHPTLLCGLALAGAKRPLDPTKDDGVLTALEVEAMDVSNVEMAVLSACETGLGKSAASEGVLGLSRAFHAGGARTVVASLWQVNDQATQRLMTDFYENLWTRGLGRGEALRQAQLKMLREGLAAPGGAAAEVIGDCAAGVAAARAMRPVGVPAAAPGERSSPYYWAAFVLSGAWE